MSPEEDAEADGEGTGFMHHKNLRKQVPPVPHEEWMSRRRRQRTKRSGSAAPLSEAEASLEMAFRKPGAAVPFGDGAGKFLHCQESEWPSLLPSLWQVALPGSHGEFGKSSPIPLR